MLDSRQIRGLEIAATSHITHLGHQFVVPSQRSLKKYTVDFSAALPTCTCPDFESRKLACKHIFAAQFSRQREQGSQLPEPPKIRKPTYKQEWSAYHQAQVNEKSKFQLLLHELCKGIEEPIQSMGRPRLPLADIIFAAAFRVYSTVSCRRFSSDLREAHIKGYLSKLPSYNVIFDYFKMEMLTPYLKMLIEESSLPLRSVETAFAVDSSGLSTCRFVQWVNAKYGNTQLQERHEWVKVHLMCGVKANIVTSVEITDRHAGDCPRFKPLVQATARNFVMNEVSADKAYLSGKNLRLVVNNNAMPYIPFKSNSTVNDKRQNSTWKQMYHFYQYNQEAFFQHYHKRSNVESTFSMIKAKFGDSLRSKTDTAQVNEALCKVLCHNICVVVQSMYELGIEPEFWDEPA